MTNEVLFLASALADLVFVWAAARRGIEWLYGTVVLNLILIGIFGAKLITVFGLTTNAGNVFYACDFFATYFLFELSGRRGAMRLIVFGALFMAVFVALSQSAVRLSPDLVSGSAALNDAIGSVFSFSPRVVLASVTAYIFAQYVNIAVYDWARGRGRGKRLWFRANLANVASQLVDSLLFFTIAFIDLPGAVLLQTILLGWLVKSLVVSMGTPLLYLNRAPKRSTS